MKSPELIRWLDHPLVPSAELVGGKNASLADMGIALSEHGIRVPEGFATTIFAFRRFLHHNQLEDPIHCILENYENNGIPLEWAGNDIRSLILGGSFPADVEKAVRDAYEELARRAGSEDGLVAVAVRSSAAAEDLPEASFAGQLESYLNIRGAEQLLDSVRQCFASLFSDRVISYRSAIGMEQKQVGISVGIQRMVRSDQAAAGVMFTLDTETGFPDVTLINASWGLGEMVVKGRVTPDQFSVYKPHLDRKGIVPIISRTLGSKKSRLVYSHVPDQPTVTVETSPEERTSFALTDDEVLTLARWGSIIEAHYGRAMDIEWAKDGPDGDLFIVQARPETVHSRRKTAAITSYQLKGSGVLLTKGLSVGDAIATGSVCKIDGPSEIDQFLDGTILVTDTTDPDWVPVMKRAAGIVTNTGGRTSHAAIISRELGIPAVVGTGDATTVLNQGTDVTISCAEGDTGHVYAGTLDFEVRDVDLDRLPEIGTPIMMNVASPAAAMRWWRLPVAGIGLARMEYIISDVIRIHPMALLRPDAVDEHARRQIEELTKGWDAPTSYFVDLLSQGIATIAASQAPKPVIVRMSDFKTNEYAGLIGGNAFEPTEDNPMLGWRGASRYYSEGYRAGFELECEAIRRVRDTMGFQNVIVMIPFCRTLEEADWVLQEMAANGLERGRNGLEIYIMAEIPSNILLAEEFARRFDGFSIGSNDLTQLTLGVDRDAAQLAYLFDERDMAVSRSIRMLIEAAHQAGKPVGICGQGPSDYPEFARFLVDEGIDSISVIPDSVVSTIEGIAGIADENRAAVRSHDGMGVPQHHGMGVEGNGMTVAVGHNGQGTVRHNGQGTVRHTGAVRQPSPETSLDGTNL